MLHAHGDVADCRKECTAATAYEPNKCKLQLRYAVLDQAYGFFLHYCGKSYLDREVLGQPTAYAAAPLAQALLSWFQHWRFELHCPAVAFVYGARVQFTTAAQHVVPIVPCNPWSATGTTCATRYYTGASGTTQYYWYCFFTALHSPLLGVLHCFAPISLESILRGSAEKCVYCLCRLNNFFIRSHKYRMSRLFQIFGKVACCDTETRNQ